MRRPSRSALNQFYTAFDLETIKSRRTDRYRTPFEVDRDRIIHSYAFRRLQAKTQVFKPGEYDFYRTRLTHTIEVSQIGRSICSFLKRASPYLNENFHIDPNLVEAVCLAHDLGHAPFGHAGEKTLNDLMRRVGGFEGNAQTLRLLTETMWPSASPGERRGISPTRALMDGVLKHKQNIYKEQKTYFRFVHRGLPRRFLREQSIESQIMDWADEIAYSTDDFVDGVRARFITLEKLQNWNSPRRCEPLVSGLIQSMKKERLESFRGDQIGRFIESCSLKPSRLPKMTKTNRYLYKLDIPKQIRAEQECLAQISIELVFESPAVEQLEYKSQAMIREFFGVLRMNYFSAHPAKHLLNRPEEQRLLNTRNKRARMRCLCDYISGMSDDYIIRTCRRLTDPEFGSIVDLV